MERERLEKLQGLQKLTPEAATLLQIGDYIRINFGGGVFEEGAIYNIDPSQGLILDRPYKGRMVYWSVIFNRNLPITFPEKHPNMMLDRHAKRFVISKKET